MSEFDERAELAIPASICMISGCADQQLSADVNNVGQFKLPDPAGKAGGACTSALLQVLYKDQKAAAQDEESGMSWVTVLRKMREALLEMDFDQIPQLTSSRMIEVEEDMYVVPPDFDGTKRAVLIGINYTGQQGELSGCHNDVGNIMDYLINAEGFKEKNITVLMDDNENIEPTRDNILAAYRQIVEQSEAGDVVFSHYSGHGGQMEDEDGDEDDGFDETLCPVDYESAGQIVDDDLFQCFVRPMKAGVTVTCLMDCCHSGTVLDLPYKFTADGDHVQMERDESSMGGMEAFMGAMGGIGIVGAACAMSGIDMEDPMSGIDKVREMSGIEMPDDIEMPEDIEMR